MDYSQLDWATPWGALFLLVPVALAWLAYRRRARLEAWAEPPLQPWAVAAKGTGEGRNWRSYAAWLAWALLAVAASGPRLPLQADAADTRTAGRHVVSVLVALDVSASMAAGDLAPDRLTRARLELADLTKRLQGERLGLLLYAGEAGLLLPPTDDAGLFVRALGQAAPDLIEAQDSNPAAALELAAHILGKEKIRSRAVLLVTDADNDSLAGPLAEAARKAAQNLKAAGIPLFVLVASTPAGAAIPLADGGFAEHDGGFAERGGVPVASRPALAAYAGLAPTPWQSGSVNREQGVNKSGNPRLRTTMIQLAWLWLRHQPGSELSCWFQQRVAGHGGRVRKTMITAMARKLLVALWKYVTAGVVIEGAVMKTA